MRADTAALGRARGRFSQKEPGSPSNVSLRAKTWQPTVQLTAFLPEFRDHTSDCGGHDEEILSCNIEEAWTNLKLDFEGFDFKNTPLPQTDAYLSWLKKQLVQGYPVAWMIMWSGQSYPMLVIHATIESAIAHACAPTCRSPHPPSLLSLSDTKLRPQASRGNVWTR